MTLFWYCYGTLIGESVTRDTDSEGAWSLRSGHTDLNRILSGHTLSRIVIMGWLMYCFLITTGYMGEIKASLTTPAFSQPVRSFQVALALAFKRPFAFPLFWIC